MTEKTNLSTGWNCIKIRIKDKELSLVLLLCSFSLGGLTYGVPFGLGGRVVFRLVSDLTFNNKI